ncbi:unnamed protein product [Adineta ricciae]|uniref:DDE-1 domain-containing protein n=1 Tax=Adineta ricciae TaxID=249248 RepID=A0A815QYS0_ADIRI|nr:unnamed protein product [Adineta ricciae]CAF1630794.1 unnamed protein product [Adineta ricciae]
MCIEDNRNRWRGRCEGMRMYMPVTPAMDAAICEEFVVDWKSRLATILEQYNPRDVYNCDKTGLYYKLMPDRLLVVNKDDSIGGLDLMMQKQKHKTLLFMDNVPVHPVDIKLKNTTLKFFPANTTAVIQPMNQGAIRTFKAYYRQQLIQQITIKLYCKVEFMTSSTSTDPQPPNSTSLADEVIFAQVQESLKDLDSALRHVSIFGTSILTYIFFFSILQDVDVDLPTFNEWNDDSEKLLSIHVIGNEDSPQNEDFEMELLTTARYPELHSLLSQFQSKLIDIYLDSNNVKQKSILDCFQSDGLKTKNFL